MFPISVPNRCQHVRHGIQPTFEVVLVQPPKKHRPSRHILLLHRPEQLRSKVLEVRLALLALGLLLGNPLARRRQLLAQPVMHA